MVGALGRTEPAGAAGRSLEELTADIMIAKVRLFHLFVARSPPSGSCLSDFAQFPATAPVAVDVESSLTGGVGGYYLVPRGCASFVALLAEAKEGLISAPTLLGRDIEVTQSRAHVALGDATSLIAAGPPRNVGGRKCSSPLWCT